ncbi:AAA family ATPase [Desulfobacterales bacterium HSG2]|nr:AAA family ATPase [Desulfobacterales bacterium HSG2]
MKLGQVTEFDPDKGHGFIRVIGGGDRISVHHSGIQEDIKRLFKDDIVEFDIDKTHQGTEAVNVSRRIEAANVSRRQASDSEIRENVKLDRFSLTGFKAFNKTVSLPISPITVLAGLNSHGKSSVIDALLLLRQTLLAEKRVAGEILLDWTGPFFNVDQFEEMVYDKKPEGFCLGFRFRCKVCQKHKSYKFLKPPDADFFFVKTDFSFYKQPDSDQISLEISFYAYSEIDEEAFLKVKFERLDDDIFLIEMLLELPESDSKEFPPMIVPFSYFLPIWRSDNLSEDVTDREVCEFNMIYSDFFQPVVDMIEWELLHNIKYVGPHREEPEWKYFKRKLRGNDVGSGGQDSVLLLQQHWHKKVNFVRLPEDESQVVSWENLLEEDMELGQAINETLRWMGMQKLKVEETAGVVQANFATLSPEETWVTIADVGFGVSQILPVLTTALLADTDSILIFEQPEIHLHPRAQARLAELLVCFAHTGRRIIIETHSDHLINRLRRVVAEDLSDQLAEQMSIVFVRQIADKDGAYVDPLRVNKEGLIENWPPDFLAEMVEDDEAIVRAGIAKRRRVKN